MSVIALRYLRSRNATGNTLLSSTEQLTDVSNTQYLGKISVGTPGQSLEVGEVSKPFYLFMRNIWEKHGTAMKHIYIPRSSVRHFCRVRRRTSNSGVFLDLVRRFFQVTLCGFSRLCILCDLLSLKLNPLLMQRFCLQSVLVCLFRCFLIPPVSAWFTLDQSDPFS